MKHPTTALNPLLTLEHDLLRAYAVAQVGLRDAALAHSLEGLRLEHERHLSDLTALILRLGGHPRSRRGLRGPVLEVMAAVGASVSDGAALRALTRGEEVASRLYEAALDDPLPATAVPLILRGLEGHRRRLAWFRPRAAERAGRPLRGRDSVSR